MNPQRKQEASGATPAGALVYAGVALDLSGRYVMMQDQEDDPLIPDDFDPDFWTLGVGVALKL